MEKAKEISILGCGWLGLPLAKSLDSTRFLVKGSTTSSLKFVELKKNNISPYLISIDDDTTDQIDSFLDSDFLIITIPPSQLFKSKKGLGKLIESIQKSPIKTILLISSTSIYQDVDGLVNENSQLQENSLPFKIEEQLNKHFKNNLSILRLAGLVGPQRHPKDYLSIKHIQNAPNKIINLIQLDDVIKIIHQLIRKPIHDTFNCCMDFHPTRLELFEQLHGTSKCKDLVHSESKSKIIDNSKIKEILNIEFTNL